MPAIPLPVKTKPMPSHPPRCKLLQLGKMIPKKGHLLRLLWCLAKLGCMELFRLSKRPSGLVALIQLESSQIVGVTSVASQITIRDTFNFCSD
jgi:hypothetical protein